MGKNMRGIGKKMKATRGLMGSGAVNCAFSVQKKQLNGHKLLRKS